MKRRAFTIILCLTSLIISLVYLTPGSCSDFHPKLKIYPANHPAIRYSGRIDFTLPKRPAFSAPGVTITTCFQGKSISVSFIDEFANNGRNYYEAYVDDTLYIKISPDKNKQDYLISDKLKTGKHTVVFVKRTEASIGKCTFLGFLSDGKLLAPPAAPVRKIEFIGNSITCGYGSEVPLNAPGCSEDGWGQPYHNSYQSFASIAGRALEAQYHLTAVSGIGLVRNYSSRYDARAMPEVYNKLYLEDKNSATWKPQQFVPDLIIIELGTNDFSLGDVSRPEMDSVTFVQTYISFLSKLKSYYPETKIVCISSPMMADGYPTPQDHHSQDLKNYLAAVTAHFINLKDNSISTFTMKGMKGAGCSTHPDLKQHQILAKELVPYLKTTMNW